ncbi:MAG: hypothetical protein KDB80_09430 [Planctomycetes bacterium]|nr:hypothetical protein [Planctomycetota bacterium]
MHRYVTTLACVCSALAGSLFITPAISAPDGPPLVVELELGGQTYRIVDGESAKVKVGTREVDAKIRVGAMRRFSAGGVSFEFPRDMAFEHDSQQAVEMWTLDGSDCAIMFQIFDLDAEPIELARTVLTEMLDSVGAGSEPRETKISLGGKSHAALASKVRVSGFDQNVVACGLNVGKRPAVLLLTEIVDPSTGSAAEMKAIRDALEATFEIVDDGR